MSVHDPRVTPANGHAAAHELRGVVEAARYVKGTVRSVQQPLVNLSDAPRGDRASQLLFGEAFRVIDERDGFAFGQSMRDGYCGYVVAGALARQEAATHWVAAPATHLYPSARLKAPPEVAIFFGSHVRVTSDMGEFQKISTGHFVPTGHLQRLRARFADPVGVADMFLGTPYLWGGCVALGHRLLGAGAGGAGRLRHRLPARQRPAARRSAGSCTRTSRRSAATSCSGPAMSASCRTRPRSCTPTPTTWPSPTSRWRRPARASPRGPKTTGPGKAASRCGGGWNRGLGHPGRS